MTDTLTTALQQKIDEKTKPQGSLGRLEAIALQAGQVLQTTSPVLLQPHLVVFAGDHGIAATGLVNPYPQAVTAQMVLNYLNGGAAINVFCRQHGITLKVVDSGVRYHFSEWQQHPHLVHAKINQGTRNYLEESAMTAEEAIRALEKGKEIVQAIAATGCNCIGFGEMGIGNTSSASLIMSAITGLPLETCTGRGTGANDEQLAVKLRTLQQAAARHATAGTAAPALLQAFGGYEIAMMAGAYQQAAHCGMLVLVDGFIATTALLLALQQEPGIKQHCIFAHTSGEKGHEHLLHWLQVTPLLNLGLRLGEGTGAALAFPLVQAATLFVNEMASFASASVATARS